MPSAQLLNQINKIRHAYVQIHSSSSVMHYWHLFKAIFRVHKATVCPAGFM